MKFLNYCKLLAFIVCVLTFASCQDDNEIYDSIVNETWVGDLGFIDEFEHPLESGLFFRTDGTGFDEQYCYVEDDEGIFVEKFSFTWIIANGILTLNYKNRDVPQLVLKDVYVFGDELRGVLYVDGVRDFEVTLFRTN